MIASIHDKIMRLRPSSSLKSVSRQNAKEDLSFFLVWSARPEGRLDFQKV
jgi:hypothetical protein